MWDSAAAIYAAAFLTGLPLGYLLWMWRERRRPVSFDCHADEALALTSCYCGGYTLNPHDYRHTATVCGPAREF